MSKEVLVNSSLCITVRSIRRPDLAGKESHFRVAEEEEMASRHNLHKTNECHFWQEWNIAFCFFSFLLLFSNLLLTVEDAIMLEIWVKKQFQLSRVFIVSAWKASHTHYQQPQNESFFPLS